MNRETILIIEDDDTISSLLCDLLQREGYAVQAAYSGTEAMLCFEKERFDLVLLDLMLPGLPGEEVLARIRKQSDVPVIALSAKDALESKVNLLRDGADDYITKPFDNSELVARMQALLRRNAAAGSRREVYVFKDIRLDPSTLEVTAAGTPVNLTKREYMILELLMSNPRKVFTKNNIFESVWNETFVGEDNAVNVHISNIRQKLAKAGREEPYIQTVWGIGFKMQMEPKRT